MNFPYHTTFETVNSAKSDIHILYEGWNLILTRIVNHPLASYMYGTRDLQCILFPYFMDNINILPSFKKLVSKSIPTALSK